MTQLVGQPSHVLAGTLDLVLVSSSHSSIYCSKLFCRFANELCPTDYFPIYLTLDLKPVYNDSKHTYIMIGATSIENVRHAFDESQLLDLSQGNDVNGSVACYKSILKEVSYEQCPPCTVV